MIGKRVFILVGFLTLLGQIGANAQIQESNATIEAGQPEQANLVWPTKGWIDGTPPNSTEYRDLLHTAMQNNVEDPMGQSRAILLVHKGKLVAELYGAGFDATTKQLSWSMAKSITSALVGAAVQKGQIKDIDAPMPSPWANGDPRAAASWRNWLNMTDGLAYVETGEPNFTKNDVARMMFGTGRFDTISYVSKLEQAHTPGQHWNYSSAGFHMIGHALHKVYTKANATQKPDPSEFHSSANAALFTPLGMDVQMEFDAAGTYLGGSLIWASARDYAKFGLLYLRNGKWENKQILPKNWIEFSRTKTPASNTSVYGAGWWITSQDPNDIRPVGQGSAIGPRDSYSARGFEGQIIWVVPSRDLVIVRLGLMGDGHDNWPRLLDWCQQIAMQFPENANPSPQ